ncbi:hypothetical protein PM8797T_22018 [Gimesia maris DSM 8797]|nr:hypothetical protein PM8797T_22018 [Gimesia maris DSM 8797]
MQDPKLEPQTIDFQKGVFADDVTR